MRKRMFLGVFLVATLLMAPVFGHGVARNNTQLVASGGAPPPPPPPWTTLPQVWGV